ncbi:superoxide dismutase [Streptomyces sp. NBC_00237]|uniref:superoxide dismutase n=1 Tax=Streptomyces sp. NBC_00237 TaxID=2975687 RepID=UPI002255451F|nr:superoxide dismutase [Streptomyces sp. NBC_00237]MCX5202266.1 superoxide dismutase [Streptomyces sp. NBC_00237]
MSDSFARRRLLTAGAGLGGAALLAAVGTAAAGAAERGGAARWPTRFSLPDGFRPEGIAIGDRPYAFFGSLGDGSVYAADLATGRGRVVVTGLGGSTVGLKTDDRGRLFLAGGVSRQIRVADPRTGRHLAVYDVPGAVMVNDVVLHPTAAWFTDSYRPVLYGVPLGRHGSLPAVRDLRELPLSGDWVQGDDFTANGIERTPDGRALIVADTVADGGALMRVDPRTGVARRIDVGAARFPHADGLLLRGHLLYVVQQRQNAIDVVRLDSSGTRGTAVTRITDPRFRIPTTAAAWGDRIYLPNARFDVEPTPDTEYDAVAVRAV